jgi:hypothetical protein
VRKEGDSGSRSEEKAYDGLVNIGTNRERGMNVDEVLTTMQISLSVKKANWPS